MAQLGVYSIFCKTQIERSALSWVTRFYPDISAHSECKAVELRSEFRSARELALIWSCAQTNERMLEANRDKRGAILQELLQ